MHVDFGWKQRSETEEEDVDMIPLIDVSLVLLIFFMMTATAATSPLLINMPATEHGNTLVNDPGMLWIGIDRVDGQPVYSIGKGEQGPQPDDRKLTESEVLQRLEARLQEGGSGEVRIVADRLLPYDVVKRMTALLEQRRGQGVRKIYGGVIERENP